VTTAAWVILFAALAVLALIAVGACALPVWREGVGLVKQLGKASETFGESMEPLTEALEGLGEPHPRDARGSSPVRR
jgi:hypothetical protein